MQPNAAHTSARTENKRRYTVAEASGVLGLSAEAVRSRLARGTLESTKENGTVYVVLSADQTHDRARPNGDQADTRTTDQTALVDVLRDQVEDLRRRLDTSEEANRENRRIIAALTQRIPELEAPREPRETPEMASEEPDREEEHRPAKDAAQEAPEPRSWWRRWFGFE